MTESLCSSYPLISGTLLFHSQGWVCMDYFKRQLLWAIPAIVLCSSHTATAEVKSTVSPTIITKTVLPESFGLREASAQYRIEYPSTDGVKGTGSRIDTAAVFLPKGPTPPGGWPVVAWAHGTVGVAHDCAPSLNPRTPRDQQYLNTWLSLGYAIVAPDYAGLGSEGLHHYLNARAEAWSSLDSIKAAQKIFPLKNEIILVGQSQGAHAAFASAGYQAEYAPELNINGTVLTGTPYFNENSSAATILSPMDHDDNKAITGDPKIPYIFYIFLSEAAKNPQLKAEDYFQGKALSLLSRANELCITPLTEEVMKQKLAVENSLKPSIQNILVSAKGSLQYPTLKIDHPVFIGIGEADINVPTAMQKQFATDVKAAGTQAEVHFYPGLDHSGTVNPSLRDSVPFVLSRKE